MSLPETTVASTDPVRTAVTGLGRGIVLGVDAPIPAAWAGVDEIAITDDTLGDREALDALINRLHRVWVSRTPTVIRWMIQDASLTAREVDHDPVHTKSPQFLFPHERLRFLCFANNYDARDGTLKWWWTTKAARLGVGATEADNADAVLDDGTGVLIDGGPRGPLAATESLSVISGEDIDAGRLNIMKSFSASPDPSLATDQQRAVDHGAGPARIIAPAGSGKTRTLTARVRHLIEQWNVDPGQIVAVAYNRRAADELRQRVGSGAIEVRTVHSLGWAILGDARPGLSVLNEQQVRVHLNRTYSIPKRVNADPTGPYVEALDEVRVGLRDPVEVEGDRDDVPGFADGFEIYRARLAQRAEVDHGEQVYAAVEALLRDAELRARWQHRCRHLLVDEFQDLTSAYLLLLRLVASPQLQVFGVGDDDQTIYGYAGADPGYLIDYDTYFPGSSLLALDTNYRCAPSIVTSTTHLLGYNRRRIDKSIRAGRPDSSAHGIEVALHPSDTLAVEAARRIEEWITEGVEPSDIAVLTRVNASLIPVKAALASAGISTHDLLGSDSLNRTTVRALFAWIRISLNPEQMRTGDVIEAIRRPSRGLNTIAREMLTRRSTSLSDLAAMGSRLATKQADRWGDFVEQLEGAVDLADAGDSLALISHLTNDVGLSTAAQALDSGRTSAARSSHSDDLVAIRRVASLHRDATTFVGWLQDAVSTRSSPEGVTLSSVHRVKGMEWKRVVVFGVDSGSMPHHLSTDREEERRVFHVAITRAMDHALVLADKKRPSRFVAELDGTAQPETTRATVPARSRKVSPISTGPAIDDRVTLRGGLKGVVTARSENSVEIQLSTGAEIVAAISDVVAVDRNSAADADPALVERLRDWRRAKSTELGVPAYVVLHDATIDDIAARAPTTERELAAIAGIGPSKLEHYGDDILAIVTG